MAGLLKSLPPKNKKDDKQAIKKAKKPNVPKGANKMQLIMGQVYSKLKKYESKYQLLKTDEEICDYFKFLETCDEATIDTETTSLDPISTILVGMSIYAFGRKAVYIPFNHISYITKAKTSGQADMKLVAQLLSKLTKIKWIMHNAVFDIRVIKNQLGVKLKCYWDTFLASRCIDENESGALKTLHFKYCNSEDDEALKFNRLFEGISFDEVPIKVGYLYGAGDAIKTWELYEYQKTVLTPKLLRGPYEVFTEIEMPLTDVVSDMEDNGLRLDKEYAHELSTKYSELLKKREEVIYEMIAEHGNEIERFRKKNPDAKLDDPILISSPSQVAILLYDILKLESPDKKNKRGTGEEILSQINHPICKAILEYREVAKLLTTYIDKMPEIVNNNTNKIHCRFNQYGAKTGRFSSDSPNLQNIPSKNKDIRKMFTAEVGNVLISLDFSQQEPRTLAHCSGDDHLINAYKNGKDLYSWVASMVYHLPYDQCLEFNADGSTNKNGKKRRSSMKSVLLGLMYGRGAKAISEQLECSVKEAQAIIDKFYTTFPKVKVWMDSTMQNAMKNGYVETIWGRRRRLPDLQLKPYEITYSDDRVAEIKKSNFDPLDFSESVNGSNSNEVDKSVSAKILDQLSTCKWFSDRKNIIESYRQKGINIKDNGGFIADAERQCINSIIQGSSADMVKKSLINIHNNAELKKLGCKIVVQVHDEIIVEAPKCNAKRVSELVAKIMVSSAKEKVSVPMKCDAEITERWYGEEVQV